MRAVVGVHVRLVEVPLFVVHPREGPTVGVLHEGGSFPVDSVGAVLQQGFTEVDEGEFGKTEHRGDPPIGMRHPWSDPAQFVVEPEQVPSVLLVEPGPESPPTEGKCSVFLCGAALQGHSPRVV
jgi:hypothetical protein